MCSEQVINLHLCNVFQHSAVQLFIYLILFFIVHIHVTCTLQRTRTDMDQMFQVYLVILVSAFSATQVQEALRKQCSSLAHSQASLWSAKLSTQKRSTQKPVILGFDSVMALSPIRAYIMWVCVISLRCFTGGSGTLVTRGSDISAFQSVPAFLHPGPCKGEL